MPTANSTVDTAPSGIAAKLAAMKNTVGGGEKPAEMFQHYKSSRTAMKMITDKGKKIIFAGYEFLTQDEAIIAYLDEAIKEVPANRLGITKGELKAMTDKNPMEALKKKAREEVIAELEQQAIDEVKGISQDMGNSKQAGDASISPLSSKGVAAK